MRQPTAGSLDPQGPVAEAMADLWWLMLALGVVVFVVFAVLLALGLRDRRPASDDERHSQSPDHVGRWFVVWGVVLPAILIVVVFVATVAAMRAIPEDAPPEALAVEIVGHQWWWEIHYPEQGITIADELHIPVGRPIALELISADVIHSFWVPPLGGKRDLMPDDITTMVIQADEPGEHRTQCAEFCGLEHAQMELFVVAESADEFAAWVGEQQQSAAKRTDETAVAEKERDALVGELGISQ